MTRYRREVRRLSPGGWRYWLPLCGCLCGQTAAGVGGPATAAGDSFAARAVWPIEIQMTAPELNRLRIDARRYVPATVRAFDQALDNVAVKLKGHGSFQPVDEKPSFTLNFTKFSPGRKLSLPAKIHLNNSAHDASYLREQIASELFLAAGVPSPRVAHAWVRLNGRTLGLYVLKEGFTREFVRRHFDAGEGDLYDDDDGHDVDQRMDRDLAADSPDDQAGLQRLAAAAREPDPGRRWQRLQETLDVPGFLRFMAMELMIGHWDGYCLGQNNFRVYHDPAADKIVFLPSGMDQVFAKADQPWQADMSGLVARALLATPEGRTRYETTFRKLFDELFDSARLTRRVTRLLDDLRPELGSAVFAELQAKAVILSQQIVERERSLRAQLSEVGPAAPEFEGEVAALDGWRAVDEPERGAMREEEDPESGRILRIVADDRTAALWRTSVRLKPGRYRFEGRARAVGVAPLPFGDHHGVSLRIAGREQSSAELLGTTGWQRLQTRFEVSAAEEEVGLICQLRASAGEARFDKASLRLVREP